MVQGLNLPLPSLFLLFPRPLYLNTASVAISSPLFEENHSRVVVVDNRVVLKLAHSDLPSISKQFLINPRPSPIDRSRLVIPSCSTILVTAYVRPQNLYRDIYHILAHLIGTVV